MRDISGDEIKVRVCHKTVELSVYDHTINVVSPTESFALANLTPALAVELAQELLNAAEEAASA